MPTATNHAPVTVAVFASALAGVLMKLCAAKFGVNFEGMELDIQTIAIGLAYFIKGGA